MKRLADLTSAQVAEIVAAIPDDEWDVPDLQPAIKHAGVDTARSLRGLLGLPSAPRYPTTGMVLLGTAPSGEVIARRYGSGTSGGSWTWRRFPAGTTEAQVAEAAVLARRPGARADITKPELLARRARLQAQIDVIDRALVVLDEVEAAQAALDAARRRLGDTLRLS